MRNFCNDQICLTTCKTFNRDHTGFKTNNCLFTKAFHQTNGGNQVNNPFEMN